MACNGCLTAIGFTPGCDRTPGGLNQVLYIARLCDVEGNITREGYGGTTGKITAIDPSVEWHTITARRNTLNLTEPPVAGSGAFTPTLTFIVESIADGLTPEDGRQAMLDFAKNLSNVNAQWVVVIQEKSGVRRMLGLLDGLGMADGFTADSGTALTDVASETIVLSGSDVERGPVIAADVVLTVVS